jgi:GNAT superfamily N-acetyltransferase
MKESIVFQDTLPDIHQYWDLFQTTGWNEKYNFSIEELASGLQNSWYAVSMYSSDKLIGFGRVIADGIHHALIVDLIIHPDYQGQGLGTQLLEKLVARCRESHIRDVQLFSAKGKYPFYEKFGFERRPADAPGMQLR